MTTVENLIFLGYQVKVPQHASSKMAVHYKWIEGDHDRFQVAVSGILYNYTLNANVVYIDDYTIKDRYRSENRPPKDYVPEGFAVFWNEEKRILKFCSKTYSRMEKIKKLL